MGAGAALRAVCEKLPPMTPALRRFHAHPYLLLALTAFFWSLNWVIVAQRFPVRVRLVDPPQNLVRLGATAVIEMKHGANCR